MFAALLVNAYCATMELHVSIYIKIIYVMLFKYVQYFLLL